VGAVALKILGTRKKREKGEKKDDEITRGRRRSVFHSIPPFNSYKGRSSRSIYIYLEST
jgi:hypothetical protein